MSALPSRPHRRYPLVLLVVFLLYAAAWAYHPVDPKDWMLENALAAAFVLALIVSYRRFPFSNVSYTLIFAFLCLHTIGAHYTYSLVPYDAWAKKLTGTTINAIFGFQRNHFDRLVHFCFGLLLAYPIRELFIRIAGVRGFWGYYLPLDVTMSFSMLYELIEWAAASFFGSELGQAYLGTHILTSATKKVDLAVFTTAGEVNDGKFKGGTDGVFTVKNGGVGFGKVSVKAPQRAALIAKLTAVSKQIAAGKIKAPTK